GQVFKAEHALMGRHVAVKVLPRAKATPESEAAFRREMRILGRLDHENLVRAFDAGYDAQVYYLVTELVPGIDLRRQIRDFGAIDETAAASVFAQVARGLAFAHAQNLVHRDVKPGNILVMDDGRVKVLDLGLAGSTLEEEASRLGRVVGTMDYISPEQIRTPDDVGPPADIYSLGCSMYFSLTGTVPFPGGSRKDKMRRHLTEMPAPIHRLAPHLPQPLCHLVEAMMAKAVADRIGSADEVIQRLARWTPDRPTPLPRQPRGDALGDALAARSAGDTVEEGSAGAGFSGMGSAWPMLDATPTPAEPRPLRRAAGAAGDHGFWSAARTVLGELESVPVVGTALSVLVPAVLAGAGCMLTAMIVRGIDPVGFRRLVGDATAGACGGVAFLLVLAIQAAARVGGRHRR
ncbi:MAG: serine/threonine-protein kinase, partial [Planctomycetaceae bacterium]